MTRAAGQAQSLQPSAFLAKQLGLVNGKLAAGAGAERRRKNGLGSQPRRIQRRVFAPPAPLPPVPAMTEVPGDGAGIPTEAASKRAAREKVFDFLAAVNLRSGIHDMVAEFRKRLAAKKSDAAAAAAAAPPPAGHWVGPHWVADAPQPIPAGAPTATGASGALAAASDATLPQLKELREAVSPPMRRTVVSALTGAPIETALVRCGALSWCLRAQKLQAVHQLLVPQPRRVHVRVPKLPAAATDVQDIRATDVATLTRMLLDETAPRRPHKEVKPRIDADGSRHRKASVVGDEEVRDVQRGRFAILSLPAPMWRGAGCRALHISGATPLLTFSR